MVDLSIVTLNYQRVCGFQLQNHEIPWIYVDFDWEMGGISAPQMLGTAMIHRELTSNIPMGVGSSHNPSILGGS